jgi:uncharacterized repeat protein (TIGR03803 family)
MKSKNCMSVFGIVLLFLCSLYLLNACGSGSSAPHPSVGITATSGSAQNTVVSKAFATLLVATITMGGTPASGVAVTFTAPASGASGTFTNGTNTTMVTTGANGEAAAAFTANGTAGTYTVTAAATGALMPASFRLTNAARAAAEITCTSGSGQSEATNSAFGAPLVVQVADSEGTPVNDSGVVVTYTPPASGASATFAGGANTATTNASGAATSAMVSANGTTGAYTVKAAATIAGTVQQCIFSLTNASAGVKVVPISETPQSTAVNTTFPGPLSVRVFAPWPQPLIGAEIKFWAPAETGASGTFPNGTNTITVTTGLNGEASTTFSANGTTGAYTVMVTLVGGSVANFSLTNTASNYALLSNFDGTDGSYATAPLIQATDGNLYGTTTSGGANGSGTVFKITSSGTLTSLYSFCSQSSCSDGTSPGAALIQATDGNLYGTTTSGGANGDGTVFKITTSGTLTTLHSFAGDTDGQNPRSGLIQATDGDLYGTTCSGGANGLGTVFKIITSGSLTTLHNFAGGTMDGACPLGTLVLAGDGDLYGTAYSGGASGNGTVFKITTTGTLTTLHNFGDTYGDGANPEAALIQATDGNLYGTTDIGSATARGTVFNITTSGTLTTLHSFAGDTTDGQNPGAGLIQATNGNFYGTTSYGGTNDSCANECGTVFSLFVGLAPFVETQTTSGKVGATIDILGTDLTGATSVTFNGTAAVFTTVSASEITATVPAGATAGPVEVMTPMGTLTSSINFQVIP